MSETSLKFSAIKGATWSAIDRFGSYAGQLVINVILARLLIPEDFGLVAMLSVFQAIAQTFIDSGMGSGLIQKTDRSDIDFSTVFVFNLIVSILVYILLYFAAPFIAEFYKEPRLIELTRVLMLCIILYALAAVQTVKLTIALDFKTLAIINILKITAGGIAGIIAAYHDCKAWSLVYQTLTSAFVGVLLFRIFVKWKPSVRFSKESFKNLFGFGSKLLCAGIVAQIFNNLYNIFIGKFYSATDLAYYSKAYTYTNVAAGSITSVLQQVTYPILASIRENREHLLSVYRRLIRMTAFLVLPMMAIFAALAEPLVIVFLTEKWLPIVPYLRWLCLARVVTPVSSINMNILNANGRSDLYLKLDLSKLPLSILNMIITVPLGIDAVVIGSAITSIICFFINAWLPGKLYGYGPIAQIKDVSKMIIITAITSIGTFIFIGFFQSHIIQLITGGLFSIALYYLLSYIFKIQEIQEINEVSTKIFHRIITHQNNISTSKNENEL